MNNPDLLHAQKMHLAGLLEAIFEKNGVVLSIEDWQVARAARNLAAHDYEMDYNEVAQHFNALHALKPSLYQTANRFLQYASQDLVIAPASADFASEFAVITKTTP